MAQILPYGNGALSRVYFPEGQISAMAKLNCVGLATECEGTDKL